MKPVHRLAPPDSRPVPEVREKSLGNGHSVLDGCGSAGSAAVAAAGTPVGRPGMPGTLSATRSTAVANALAGASAASTMLAIAKTITAAAQSAERVPPVRLYPIFLPFIVLVARRTPSPRAPRVVLLPGFCGSQTSREHRR